MEPVVVSSGTAPIAAAIRYALVMLGTFAVGKGWVAAEQVEGIVTALVVIGTAGFGLYRTFTTKKSLVTVANYVPDAVAKVV